jgi:hypothetical protein
MGRCTAKTLGGKPVVKREKIGWIFIWTVAAIGLALSLCFFAGVPNAQELTKEALSAKAAKAKVGDVLTKYDAVELIKADANKITAKIYATPKWDKQGNLLVAYEAGTGIIRTQGRYVQYVPNAATGLLKVTRTTTETGVKEYWNVPDSKTTALAWAVNTDAAVSLADGRMVFTDRGKVICESPAPVAWDAKKKPVGITVKFDGKILTYDIAPGEYAYPLTVDPSVVIEGATYTTGYFHSFHASSYTDARNAAAATTSHYSGEYFLGQIYDTIYVVKRVLLRFNTSTLAGVSLDSAYVKLCISFDSSTTDFNIKMCEANDSLSTTTFDETIFDEFKGWVASGAYNPTYLSDTNITTAGKSVGDTLSFKLNAAGVSDINTGGTSQFWLLSSRDIASTTPTNVEEIRFEHDSEYLQVWYTPGPSTGLTRSVPYDKRPNYIWKNGDTVPIWKP